MLTAGLATVDALTIQTGLRMTNPANTIADAVALNRSIENLKQKQSLSQSFLEHYQSISLRLVYSLLITVRL
ncbi:hypothetical protein SAMN05421828_1527 [Acidiphilium rubrum]|uniref:Uncharacterized protein n=1 Tax=Acidiphilium rubrum TaxID=526 RepID=A0A8G2CP42_ACIRU|nr:hypothetical protein SAMN05421828_1527 [Acidiphilium rubrum]